MTQFQQTISHTVFLVRRRGNTLIVRPRGDAAGFGQAEIRAELARIDRLLHSPEFPNLIIDLGAANYFGPSVTIQMLRLGRQVVERGGRFAICNASDDMARGLNIHCDEPFWADFPSERSAVRKIVTETLTQKVAHHHRKLTVAAVAALLYCALAYVPFSHRQELNLQEVMAVWSDYHAASHRPTSPEEFARLSERAQKRLGPILKDLEARAGVLNPSAQYLLFATRDCLVPLLQRQATIDPVTQAAYTKMFHTYTTHARANITKDKQRMSRPLARLTLGNIKHRI